ncbi:PRC-barrel domain-containing protein (plasmid) [Rhizobium sp. TRM96647]|uniref:PRC-barrel domain-containing protein n=1 Tax=unclassified Rhizobium TaxID=2613769 RepID=UPI0021E82748|nr:MULTISPECIES: PRC-barrel domain-containing protein [unclassified Rhizobium]MCV3735413.1 PRC-barrel domain-containing protein [Rhizobium sp. TRM96647]MCV3757824.1 PRC-barrel domain-containing protein [Rhizobium sp. TRM96650]
MTNKLLTSVAAGAIFLGAAIAPAAFAQDTTQPQTAPTMEAPATAPDAAPATGADAGQAQPMDDMNNAQTEAPAAADPATDTAASTTDTYLTEQAETQISANTYIGQSVYNSADESIGSISDLILEKDGGITAAVIGVGGFLGIGEKAVAVPFNNITVIQAPDGGEVKLTTTETSESLQAAPEFKTLSQKVAEREQVDTSTTSSTDPAPATAPAE